MNDQHILKKLAEMLSRHFNAEMSVSVQGSTWRTDPLFTVTTITEGVALGGYWDDDTPVSSISFDSKDELRDWLREVVHASI